MKKSQKCGDGMNRVRLESIRGLLVYVSRTYQYMNPYLKGLHLTLDRCRPHRAGDGCKLRG